MFAAANTLRARSASYLAPLGCAFPEVLSLPKDAANLLRLIA